MKQNTYMVSVACSWLTPVKASSMEEAIRKPKSFINMARADSLVSM